jgi:hypothetical protein
MISRTTAKAACNRCRCGLLNIVLVHPGSVKKVMFIALDDEADIATLVDWRNVFETKRRVILGAGMIATAIEAQREHEVAHNITYISIDLARIDPRGDAFTLSPARGGERRSTGRSLSGAQRGPGICIRSGRSAVSTQ